MIFYFIFEIIYFLHEWLQHGIFQLDVRRQLMIVQHSANDD